MSTRTKITFRFAVACFLLLIAIVSANISTSKFIDDTRWLVHTMEVRSEIEKVSTHFIAAQNNIRAYHVTQQQYYLDLHTKALSNLRQSLNKLKVLTTDNSEQQKNVDEVFSWVESKIKLWDGSFEIRRKKGFEGIRQAMMGPDGKHMDTQLFESVEELKAEEETLFDERMRESQTQGRAAKIVIWAGGIIMSILISIAALLVYRDGRRRELAEADMNRFFTLSLDLLCISGMDGYFKRLSPSYADVLGYSLKELYSKPITDFVHPEDIQRTNDEVSRQMKGEKVLNFENRFRCKDGKYKIFSWKSVPVGEFMYAVARDVTQQRIHEADLTSAREAAQNAAVAKSAFLANMSHEIRTPLNGVVGMTDLLSRTELRGEQKGYVTAIKTSSNILLKIVNEILDFSKIEAGRVNVEKVDFDLSQLIEGRISLLGVLAHEKNLKLEAAISPDVPRVLRGDSGKIGQVLLNLINNAIKFTAKGKILVSAEVVSQDSKTCTLKIKVADSGVGIETDQLSRLFQPFVQADNSTARKYGGTGLGLSISKRLVEIMGGTIGAESHAGLGSIFSFTIPLEISDLKELKNNPVSAAPAVRRDSTAQKALRKSIRILVAEDNPTNQIIAMSMMTALGYSAELAQNGKEAVAKYKADEFDLILMDQHMPVMDGVQASTEIRELEKQTGKHIPIIAFTATVIQEDQKAFFDTLMDGFILKPVTLDALESTLVQWEDKILETKGKG